MATIQLLLRALQHPQADSVQMDSLRNLVVWLEDRKIRAYKVEDRRVLADIQSSQWHAAYDKVGGLESGHAICAPSTAACAVTDDACLHHYAFNDGVFHSRCC